MADLVKRSLRKSLANTATNKGWVVTSVTELATDVYLSDEVHVMKCSPKKQPLSRHSLNSSDL